MKKTIAIFLMALSVIAVSEAKGKTPAGQLQNRLKKIEKQRLMAFGHHDDTAYGHTWTASLDGERRSDVKDVCGDFPGIMNWDLGLVEWQCESELDGVPFDFIREEVKCQAARGGINSFSWHPRNPVTRGDSWDCKGGDIVKECVTPGTVLNDTMTLWLQRAADFIGSLRDARGNRIPVIFRPWHEHTGSWFWWGRDFCTADEYKALWHLTRAVFDEKGIDNVVWAYSPDKIKNEADYFERYPGDGYVDLLGADVYHFDGAKGVDSYLERLNSQLSAATSYAKTHGKLVALTETGSEGLPMSDWWMEVLLPAVAKYPVCYVSVWRNANEASKPMHFYAPFPGQASASSFVRFYNDKRTLFAKDLKKIK